MFLGVCKKSADSGQPIVFNGESQAGYKILK